MLKCLNFYWKCKKMMNDFAIFIMVYGRPEKMWTYKSLRNQGYTGKIFLVGDDTDKTIDGYKKKYGGLLETREAFIRRKSVSGSIRQEYSATAVNWKRRLR